MLASELLNTLMKNLGDNKADVTKESDEASKLEKDKHHNHEITHHFKLTQTTEGEVTSTDIDDDKKVKSVEKKKKKKRGCFASCFGKRGEDE